MVQITIQQQLVTLDGGNWSCEDKDLRARLAALYVRAGATELEHAIEVAQATGGEIVLIDEPSCHTVIKPVVVPATKVFENALSDFQSSGPDEAGQPEPAPQPPAAQTRKSRT